MIPSLLDHYNPPMTTRCTEEKTLRNWDFSPDLSKSKTIYYEVHEKHEGKAKTRFNLPS